MRVFFTWRAWLCAGLISLPCLSLTGCKSTGTGGSWLSWMSPKPSTSSLASAVPTKPSVNLPAPSATTGTPPAGTTGLASVPTAPATAGSAAPAAAPANNYYTGPYGMAGQTPNTLPAASGTGYAATGYSTTPPAQANPASSYGGYQSSATAPSSAYRTADTRSGVVGGTAGGYPASPTGSTYGAASSTNPSVAAGGSTWNRTPQQPVSYGAPSAAQPADTFQTTPGAWGSSQVATAPRENSLDPGGASAASGPVAQTAALPARSGAFRPGSTARNTGVLPVSTSAAATSAAPGGYSAAAAAYPATSAAPSAYPGTAYPATTYPGTEPAARTAMPTTGYNSGYSYPSTTTQTR